MTAGPYPVQAPGLGFGYAPPGAPGGPSGPGCPPAPQLQPLLLRIGDDWSIPVVLADTLGNPLDLTGSTVTARLYGPFPIDVAGANGSVSVTAPAEGGLTVLVNGTATGSVVPASPFTKTLSCSLSIAVVDSLGHRHTYDPIPLLPLLPQAASFVPAQVATQLLTAYQQGPAGASNSLTAAQVEALVTAAVAAAAISGPPGPATTLTIGSVTTGAPGTPAEAEITGAAPNLVLDLTLPEGEPGAGSGSPGPSPAVVLTFAISAATSFTATHAFAYRPRAWLTDADGTEVETDVAYAGEQVTVTFAAPFTGTLYLG